MKFLKGFLIAIFLVLSFYTVSYAAIDIENGLIFSADYNQSTTDSINNIVPTGSVVTYEALGGGNYAARFLRSQSSGLSYNVTSIESKLGGANAFTLATRVRYSSLVASQYNAIVARWSPALGSKRQFLLNSTPGSTLGCNQAGALCSVLSSNGTAITNRAYFGSSVTPQQWYTLVMVYDGSTTKTYLDGVLTDTKAGVLAVPVSTPLEIGYFNADVLNTMNGFIDGVHIWEGAADTSNIAEISQFFTHDFTVTYTAGANGSLTGTTSQDVAPGGSGTAVTAVPATGYSFVGWSDGSIANPRTDTNVTATTTVRAAFAKTTALATNQDFITDKGYGLLFKTDFEQNVIDSARNVSPISSVVTGYTQLNGGGYAVTLTKETPTLISYDTSGTLYNGLYDDDGFSVVTRYRLDSLNAGGYVASVAGVYGNGTSQRSWLLSHNNTGNATHFSVSVDGSENNVVHTPVVNGINQKLGDWITVVATYDGSNQVKTYYDGALVSTVNTSIYPPGDLRPLLIGGFFNGSMSGAIDYVYIVDRKMLAEDIGDFFGTDLSEGGSAPQDVNSENSTFVNSDGLTISYDVYYNTGNKGPLVLMGDSWDSAKENYRDDMKYMRDTYGFVAANLNTRGKGTSTGYRDAIGYECKDIYELSKHLQNTLGEYYDSTQGVHMLGYSAGGGKALLCSGKYPDYFTSVYATGSVANLARWYQTINTTSYPADRPSIRERVGNSVNPGVAFYHPAGFSSVNGSTENQEAYDARNASTIGAYNTLASVYLSHNTGDPRVNVQLSQDYNTNWNAYNKTQDYQFVTCAANVHSRCNMTEGQAFVNAHKGVLTLPSSGDFKIGGWVETKRFKVEFLDDVGYTGTVNYEFGQDNDFTLTVDADTYTGPTEIVVQDVHDYMNITDNDVSIAEIRDGVVTTSDPEYSATYTNGVLRLVIASVDQHSIKGVAVEPPIDPNPVPEKPRTRVVGGSYMPGTIISVSTDTTACRPGDLFSTVTGARCSSTPVVPGTVPTFTRSLSQGMSGADIKTLQQYLNNNGYPVALTGAGSQGFETTFFGPATRAAVIKFQLANKITPAVGFFGPVTRSYIK